MATIATLETVRADTADDAAEEGPPPTDTASLFRKFWDVLKPFLIASRSGRWICVLVLVLACLSAAMDILISFMNRDFFNAITNKDRVAFYESLKKFVAVIVVAVPLSAYTDYAKDVLKLQWRQWLTTHLLGKYFDCRARPYYTLRGTGGSAVDMKADAIAAGATSTPDARKKMTDGGAASVDNPDQRLCEDVRDLTDSSVVVMTTILDQILTLVGFAGVLWSIAPDLVVVLVVYAAIGTGATIWIFGPPIVNLNWLRLRKEADFRFSLVRVRENAESIAFYDAANAEAGTAGERLASVVSTVGDLIWWTRNLGFFQLSFHHATVIIPACVLAPRYFDGQIEFGVITQGSQAFSSILRAVSFIVFKFDRLTALVAQVDRLHALISELERIVDEAKGPEEQQLTTQGTKIAMKRGKETDPLMGRSGKEHPLPPELGGSGGGGDGGAGQAAAADSGEKVGGFGRSAHHRLEGDRLMLDNLTLDTPLPPGVSHASAASSRTRLCEDLSFSLEPGQALLIIGPSGCGASNASSSSRVE